MMQRRRAATVLAPIALASLAFLSGCGGEEGNASVEPSTAAKKAEQANQDAMRKTMESKGKSKSAKH